MIKKIKEFKSLLVKGFKHFQKNQPLMLASATSFFTTFSLPPITILVVNILSFYFFKADRIRENLYQELSVTFGNATADQISSIANNFRGMADNTFYTIAGTVFLIFVATTLFFVVQTAIHQIWRIKYNENRKFKHLLIQRGVSFLMIVAASVLMLLTLLSETILSFIGDKIGTMFPDFNQLLIIILGIILSLVIYTLWFAILYRYLPDARIPFNIAFKGGLFTAVLFWIGKYLLGFLLVTDRMGNLFGASASIMVLMLFIFYSSMMVYFGASFTYVLLRERGKDMRTKKYSEHIPT
jgi:membrane protein